MWQTQKVQSDCTLFPGYPKVCVSCSCSFSDNPWYKKPLVLVGRRNTASVSAISTKSLGSKWTEHKNCIFYILADMNILTSCTWWLSCHHLLFFRQCFCCQKFMGWTNPSTNSSQPTGPPSDRHFQDPLGIGAANDERRGPDWDAQRWQDFLAGDLGEMSTWPPENNWGVLWLVGVYSCGLGWKRYFSMFMFQYVVLYSTVDVFVWAKSDAFLVDGTETVFRRDAINMSRRNVSVLHSGKLTWQWKMDPLKIYFLLKVGIFHCYVSLPEGIHFHGTIWMCFFLTCSCGVDQTTNGRPLSFYVNILYWYFESFALHPDDVWFDWYLHTMCKQTTNDFLFFMLLRWVFSGSQSLITFRKLQGFCWKVQPTITIARWKSRMHELEYVCMSWKIFLSKYWTAPNCIFVLALFHGHLEFSSHQRRSFPSTRKPTPKSSNNPVA